MKYLFKMFLLVIIFKFIFLSTISHADNFKSIKVNFSGNLINAIIPNDYCDYTNNPVGKEILNYLNEQSKRNPILPKFKIFFAPCDNLSKGILYPMGWIGFQKSIRQYKNQKSYNNAVSKLMGNTKFIEKYFNEIEESSKEIMREKYDLYLEAQNISKPKLLWKDNFSIIFQAINEETLGDGTKLRAVNVGSSTILRNAIIHTYISNDIKKEPNALKIASILIENSKVILKSN